jgi:Flp pilus assembly protein TadG
MKTSRKSRRGSTLVMVAIMMVAFVGVGAIGADVGRFYVITNEMQTAADAAALAGAVTLSTTASSTPEAIIDADVIDFVSRTNNANNAPLTVSGDNVKMVFYTPRDSATNTPESFTYNPTVRPNAVSVLITASPTGFFSKLLGRTGALNLGREGVAWIANLSSNCVRPMAFPYLPLYNQVMGTSLTSPTSNALDPVKFITYSNQPFANRMFVVLGQNQASSVNPTTHPNDGEWNGFNFTGNAGKPGFTDGITGCRNYTVNVDAGNGVTLPGQANQYVNWANQEIDQVCAFKANNNAGCYLTTADTIPGRTINVAFGDVVGVGSNGVDFKYVGEFVLTCYFRGNAGESCPLQKGGAPATGYPAGTMVGGMQVLKSRIITQDDVLGNSPSNIQRIILVK